jgi:hypothetical protein
MKSPHIIYIIIIFLTLACSKSTSDDNIINSETTTSYEWTVPLKDIIGTLDPFPLMENPILNSIENTEGLTDESTVIIVSFNGETNIYPLSFIHSFEVVNDHLSNFDFAISYCPITQSTINVNRVRGTSKFTYRASGILYKENLVMFDGIEDSYWSQMLLKGIKGPFAKETINLLPMLETSWKTAKTFFPSAKVFANFNTSSSKNNKIFKTTENISNNEKVFGYIDNLNSDKSNVFIYRYSDFSNEIKIFNSGVDGKKIVIGSFELNFITSFFNDKNYIFTTIQNEFPIIMVDDLGNKWDVFGLAVEGPNKGDQLRSSTGFIASWWAWKDFYTEFSHIE